MIFGISAGVLLVIGLLRVFLADPVVESNTATRNRPGDFAIAGTPRTAVPDVGIDGACGDLVLCALHGA